MLGEVKHDWGGGGGGGAMSLVGPHRIIVASNGSPMQAEVCFFCLRFLNSTGECAL